MERGLQKANHYNKLAEWEQRVEACRKSGRKVSAWCSEQGIPVPTYYSWQRKVYQTVAAEPEVCFTEISAGPAGGGTAASIESGELRIEIHAGPDQGSVLGRKRLYSAIQTAGEREFPVAKEWA